MHDGRVRICRLVKVLIAAMIGDLIDLATLSENSCILIYEHQAQVRVIEEHSQKHVHSIGLYSASDALSPPHSDFKMLSSIAAKPVTGKWISKLVLSPLYRGIWGSVSVAVAATQHAFDILASKVTFTR